MTRISRTTLTGFLLVVAATLPVGQLAGQEQDGSRVRTNAAVRSSGLYIVQMADLPVGSYIGGVPGLDRTKPPRGRKIDALDPAVVSYRSYLRSRHDETLSRVRGRKVYDYGFVFNGFAADLSDAEADVLRSTPGVLSVVKDELRSMDTSSTPAFLGLNAPGGAWDQSGGVDDAGEDVVIGVVDSGIWPENDSFSDRTTNGKKTYQHIPGWRGHCRPGEQFPASKCNQKLIAARHFNAAWGGDAGLKAQYPWEFASPRDYNGHGSHTAATAAGNRDVQLTGDAAVLGSVSGIAPRARIAVYKALWSLEDGSQASGYTSDLVAAIDQAVADGVDVINYSVSGTQTNFLDPAQVAFLFAADAGVFVSASAGNAGPASGTVAHPSPWITTVAAGTHNRNGEGSVRLGNGVTYIGASLANALAPAPLINASAAAKADADPTAVALCFAASDNGGTAVLDPAKVAGKIVVCDRGVNARVNKSLAVKEAGGVGMILVNTAAASLNADFHFVPSVHLAHTDAAAVHAYADLAQATATIAKAAIVYNMPAPLTASFSSRGPTSAAGGDLLKPDVIAPGQDIVAAVAPPGNAGRLFNIYSGTSMSAPHVAGLAALLRDQHPDWSPMMIKSALMTTAGDVLDGPNTNPVVIFRQGAGHVRPSRAADPGLVFDADAADWLAFLCGTTAGVPPATCQALKGAGYSTDPSDVNVPSIAIGSLVKAQTVTRRVTNVGGNPAVYTSSIAGLTGMGVTVTPSTLSIAPGETKSFNVTFTQAAAPFGTYSGGHVTWTDGSRAVRVPVTVRPVPLVAPASVFGTGEPISYGVTFGYNGPFSATPRGLVPATLSTGSVADDPGNSFAIGGPGVTSFSVTIPAGTTLARFSTFDSHVSPASDVDVYVYRGATLVGASGGPTSEEQVTLRDPVAATYTVYVHGYDVPGTANFTLFSWLVGSAAAGNMSVSAPATAVSGKDATITLSFSGLAGGTKYLGSVAYSGSTGMPAPTIVRVDTP